MTRIVTAHERVAVAPGPRDRYHLEPPSQPVRAEEKSAIGYVRTDICGVGQVWDEAEMRCAADEQGYDLRKTIAFAGTTFDPIGRLADIAAELGVDAVFSPSFAHLGDVIPDRLIRVCAVVVVKPLIIYPRFDPLPVR